MASDPDWTTLDRSAFGNGPEMADALLALVLAGTKTATCWPGRDGAKGTALGKPWVVLDGAGTQRAMVLTTELTVRRFDQVDAAFAHDEGEGDRSLAAWRRDHERYFTHHGGYSPTMTLWCERFRLVATL